MTVNDIQKLKFNIKIKQTTYKN